MYLKKIYMKKLSILQIVHKIHSKFPSVWPPFLTMHKAALLRIACVALVINSLLFLKISNSCKMLSLNAMIFNGGDLQIRDFMYPHKKKSHGVKSGDLGGHSVSWPRETTCLPKSCLNLYVTTFCRWQGAPSWNHQTFCS